MKHRIVVLGAGYAGATAAGRLAKRLHSDDALITLVNADPDFVERVRMHQLAAGQDLRPRPLREYFAGTGVQVVTALVTAVDVDRKTVDLDGGDSLGYDSLVYALGSVGADHGVPGVSEHAHSVAGKQAALRLRARLNELSPGATVVVVGGGLTGIEAATEIAETRPDLAISIAARGGVGDWLSEKAQRHLCGTFDRLGITVHDHIDITRVTAGAVIDGAAREIPADMTVWTTGFAAHPLAAATALQVSGNGQIVVDRSMRSVSHPDVYAVGDAVLAEGAGGKPLRMSCASGGPTAWQAADALAARLTGREVPETTIGYNFQCISLGRRDGIIQPVTPDDQAKPTAITGRAAACIKELVCSGAAWGIGHPTLLMPSRRRHVAATGVAESGLVTPRRG